MFDNIIAKQKEVIKSRISSLYTPAKQLKKSEDADTLQKASKGGGAPPGTIKMMGNREYIKASDGQWKYHGKGKGQMAQNHASAAHTHNVNNPTSEGAPNLSAQAESDKIAAERMGDINFRFKMFAAAVKGVINGKFKSCIAYGTGGVGKTYTVTGQLAAAGKIPYDDSVHRPVNSVPQEAEEGDESFNSEEPDEEGEGESTDYDYVKITGKMTAPQVYKTLYEHNGKILLFDDCDSVLTDGSAVNLFKGALDSSGDGTIQYATSTGVKDDNGAKLPKRFKFTGRAIFVSNLTPQAMPQPLKSRAVSIDLTMNKKQTLDRIKEIAKDKNGKYQNLKFPGIDKYTHEHMNDVINYLDDIKEHVGDLNVRTVGKVLGMHQIAHEMGEGHEWQRYADQTMFSKGEDFYNGGLLKAQQNFVNQLYKSKTPKDFKSEDVKSGIHISEEQMESANFQKLEDEGVVSDNDKDNVKKSEELDAAFGSLIK